MTPAQHIPIAIIGGGISGLTLSRTLLARSIPSVIYERAPPPSKARRIDYSITLASQSRRTLLDVLDEKSSDPLTLSPHSESLRSGKGQIRLHRKSLEANLAKGLDIRWDHELASVALSPDSMSDHGVGMPPTTLSFLDGSEVSASLVIGADGVHSRLRNGVAPSQIPNVLPYVMFRGKLEISDHTFRSIYKDYTDLPSNAIRELRRDNYTLRVLVEDQSAATGTLLSWTYSRPAQGPEDALFQPNRSVKESKIIPESFYQEIQGIEDLQEPFRYIFNNHRIRGSRIHNWLMQDIIFDEKELRRLAERGIVFLGDAAHAAPMIGSQGADLAIQDAVDLANCLADHGINGSTQMPPREKITSAINSFYKGKISGPGVTSSGWRAHVEDGERRLAAMHTIDGTLKGNL